MLPHFRLPEKKGIMFPKRVLAAFALCALAACGFKGDLYLPKPNDNNKFGVVQTGWDLKAPPAASAPAAASSASESMSHE